MFIEINLEARTVERGRAAIGLIANELDAWSSELRTEPMAGTTDVRVIARMNVPWVLIRPGLERVVGGVSAALGEDCIAVRPDVGPGRLIGPKADEWGEFNPEFFVRF